MRSGPLQRVLEAYAPTVPGFVLHDPSSARCADPLRRFIDVAKELSAKAPPAPPTPRRDAAERA